MSIGKWVRGALGLLALAATDQVRAQSTDERYSFQGFGGWAFADTNNDNRSGFIASEQGDWNNYYFALNVAARPLDKLSIRAQAFWAEDQRGKRVNLDYAFAEWAHSPALKLRVGKTPVPFGIYTEVYDVGTVRPFYMLPQFYEGPLGLIPKSYVGVGVTGGKPLGEQWELQYDAFGGEIHLEPFSTDALAGFDPATQLPVFVSVQNQLVGREMVGARLLLASPAKGLDFGATLFYVNHLLQSVEGGELQEYSVTDHATFANVRARYQKNGFALQAEWLGALARDADVKSIYAEASYKLDRHWQVAAQYENSDISIAPTENFPEPLRHHESYGLALNYWVSPEFALKLNGYKVDGNMIAQPELPGLRAALGSIDQSTTVVVVGAQFSF